MLLKILNTQYEYETEMWKTIVIAKRTVYPQKGDATAEGAFGPQLSILCFDNTIFGTGILIPTSKT